MQMQVSSLTDGSNSLMGNSIVVCVYCRKALVKLITSVAPISPHRGGSFGLLGRQSHCYITI